MEAKSLYIHIPFCAQKCLYCDFVSFAGKVSLINDYIEALVKELDYYKAYTFDTVYIGGGTPTFLNVKNLKRLGEGIKKLQLTNDVEFSAEANPGTFSMEKLECLKEMGVNRLSIGLQSFDNNTLKLLGRIHTAEDFHESYNLARMAGFNNINIDLMFGLPKQSFEIFRDTLEKVVALGPEHISSYSLIVEENTVFYDKYLHGEGLPSEELEREMYKFATEYLKSNGYNQYEISNFARENKECKHNIVYWTMKDYIGCGLNSSSYINNKRIENIDNINKYNHAVNIGKKPIKHTHYNSIKDNMEEFMFMGLRMIKGISKSEFNKKFNTNIYDIYGKVFKKYISLSYLIDQGDYIRLSFEGLQISNIIMADLLLD